MCSHTVREIMRPAAAVIDGRTPVSATVQYFLDQEVATVFVTSPEAVLLVARGQPARHLQLDHCRRPQRAADEDRLPDADEALRAGDVRVVVERPADVDRLRRATM